MTAIRVPGVWCCWECRGCKTRGERRFESLHDLQIAMVSKSLVCSRCGGTLLNVYVPGPFPAETVDAMKRAADDGCTVTGMDGKDGGC